MQNTKRRHTDRLDTYWTSANPLQFVSQWGCVATTRPTVRLAEQYTIKFIYWLHDAQYIICSGDRVSYWTSPSLWPELQTVGGATWKYNNIIIVSRSQNLYNSSTNPSYAPEELGTRLL